MNIFADNFFSRAQIALKLPEMTSSGWNYT